MRGGETAAENHSSLFSNDDVGGGVSSFLKSAARTRDNEEDFEEDAEMFWVPLKSLQRVAVLQRARGRLL